MKDNIFGSEAFILLTKMEKYIGKHRTPYTGHLTPDTVHRSTLEVHRKSTLAFIRHCSLVGGGGNDKLAIDKGGNLPEKVENHWSIFTVRQFTLLHVLDLNEEDVEVSVGD